MFLLLAGASTFSLSICGEENAHDYGQQRRQDLSDGFAAGWKRGSGCNQMPSPEGKRFAFAMFHLFHRALTRRFVRPPSQDPCAVPKSAAGKMIVGNFDHDFRVDRFPFAAAICAPTTRATWRIASESGGFFNPSNFFAKARRSFVLNEDVNPT